MRSIASEAVKYTSSCEGTGCKDSFGYFAIQAVLLEEDEMILSEHVTVKNNHGACIRSSCSDVGVDFE